MAVLGIRDICNVLKHRLGMEKIPIRGLQKMNYWGKLKGIAFNFGRIHRYIRGKKGKSGDKEGNNFVSSIFRLFFDKIFGILTGKVQFKEKSPHSLPYFGFCFCR